MTIVDNLIAIAQSELGKPYVYDAAGPTAFDCSGLTQYAFAQVGIQLPHNAAQQQQQTTRVSQPLPGDLVFYGSPAYHVGLYIGGGKMISAPAPGKAVHITDVGNPTNYGRVGGLNTALNNTVGIVTTPVSNVFDNVLSNAKYVVTESLFVVLGLGLLGYGLYRGLALGSRWKVNLGGEA